MCAKIFLFSAYALFTANIRIIKKRALEKDSSVSNSSFLSPDEQKDLIVKLAEKTTLLKGFKLRAQQFRGMFVKCLLHASRNRGEIIFQLLMPLLHVLVAISIINSIPTIGDQPSMDLSLKRYEAPYSDNLQVKFRITKRQKSLISARA